MKDNLSKEDDNFFSSLLSLLQDELIAMSEKAVLRVTDLLDWIADPKEVHWDRGLVGICEEDCSLKGTAAATTALEDGNNSDGKNAQYDPGLNAKFTPGHSDFLADIRLEKKAIGKAGNLGAGRLGA